MESVLPPHQNIETDITDAQALSRRIPYVPGLTTAGQTFRPHHVAFDSLLLFPLRPCLSALFSCSLFPTLPASTLDQLNEMPTHIKYPFHQPSWSAVGVEFPLGCGML